MTREIQVFQHSYVVPILISCPHLNQMGHKTISLSLAFDWLPPPAPLLLVTIFSPSQLLTLECTLASSLSPSLCFPSLDHQGMWILPGCYVSELTSRPHSHRHHSNSYHQLHEIVSSSQPAQSIISGFFFFSFFVFSELTFFDLIRYIFQYF